jgi:hypothetical protein
MQIITGLEILFLLLVLIMPINMLRRISTSWKGLWYYFMGKL